jgi:hypothetical protein
MHRYSTGITCPLGAALTAQQVLLEGRDHDRRPNPNARPGQGAGSRGGGGGGSTSPIGSSSPSDSPKAARPNSSQDVTVGNDEDGSSGDDDDRAALMEDGNGQTKNSALTVDKWDNMGSWFRGQMVIAVVFSVIIAASGAPSVFVIIMAQIINGLLLPILTVCLFVCMNDTHIVAMPPSLLNNISLVLCVVSDRSRLSSLWVLFPPFLWQVNPTSHEPCLFEHEPCKLRGHPHRAFDSARHACHPCRCAWESTRLSRGPTSNHPTSSQPSNIRPSDHPTSPSK